MPDATTAAEPSTSTAALAALGDHLYDQGLPEGGRPSLQ